LVSNLLPAEPAKRLVKSY